LYNPTISNSVQLCYTSAVCHVIEFDSWLLVLMMVVYRCHW